MGVRYRKSIRLGGGFRINLSKSGVGYSWGVKGYRITKTARGTTRTTASIPGTGISYVREKSNLSKRSSQRPSLKQQPSVSNDTNQYDTERFINDAASSMISEGLDALLASANRALWIKKISSIGFWIFLIAGFANPGFLIPALIFAGGLAYIWTAGRINLIYDIDEEQKAQVTSRMNVLLGIAECDKIWRVMQTSKVVDSKYTAGANQSLNRAICTSTTKAPFPFKTNENIAAFKAKGETLLFLPDKLFVIQKGKMGALSYDDISSSIYKVRFVEHESVPKDTQVVDKTWKYVNKSGSPDQRFKDNSQLPICLYGALELKSPLGLNVMIMYSNSSVG